MSERIRALIVEDEPHARSLLRSMLDVQPRIQVVAEAPDGRAAVQAIAAHAPELVFLDVQMPELDGFEVLRAVEAEGRALPAVIFVTAFDQYAIRAFEVHALDYLLKPFDAERVDRAVDHAVEQMRRVGSAEIGRRLAELLDELQARAPRAIERIPVKTDGRVRFVAVDDVDWIEADDHMIKFHAGKDVHVVRDTLAGIEHRLDASRFVRLHRGIIVNVRRIKEVQPWFQGDYVVVLEDGTKLTSGRTYRENVRRLLDLRGA